MVELGPLEPVNLTREAVKAGDITIATTSPLAVGSEIVLEYGTPHEESARVTHVAGVGPYYALLDRGLARAHREGSRVETRRGPCTHRRVIPVESVVDGAILAWLCLDCDGQLSMDWLR